MNESAPPGKELKYARPEFERRFLLTERPAFEVAGTIRIHDRYVHGTRIRLRRAAEVDASGERVFYKLTQKVPGLAGRPGLITTMYLSAAEYAVVAGLPADKLSKVRRSIPPLGVDEFEGPLTGLWLAEAEFDSEEEFLAFVPPDFVVAEVTGDERFTGGSLVVAGRTDIETFLADYGVHLPDETGFLG